MSKMDTQKWLEHHLIIFENFLNTYTEKNEKDEERSLADVMMSKDIVNELNKSRDNDAGISLNDYQISWLKTYLIAIQYLYLHSYPVDKELEMIDELIGELPPL
jgi:hypothetical protein